MSDHSNDITIHGYPPTDRTPVRRCLESIRDRHLRRSPWSSQCRCGELWPCPDNQDAVAALGSLYRAVFITEPQYTIEGDPE